MIRRRKLLIGCQCPPTTPTATPTITNDRKKFLALQSPTKFYTSSMRSTSSSSTTSSSSSLSSWLSRFTTLLIIFLLILQIADASMATIALQQQYHHHQQQQPQQISPMILESLSTTTMATSNDASSSSSSSSPLTILKAIEISQTAPSSQSSSSSSLSSSPAMMELLSPSSTINYMRPQKQQQQQQQQSTIIKPSTRNGLGQFSPLDIEVVDRLIKQWAPVVWLAPEEKFMPLGVDEFLHHVHATMDKGKTFIPGMPIGEISEKTYLVTNDEIDELLDNEKSFIHGRNPNESPVPIYAVVSLCNNPADHEFKTKQSPPPQPKPQPPLVPARSPSSPPSSATGTSSSSSMASSTRGPYIPVSIDPLEERDETLRRSSRLYPVFQRVRRDITPPFTAHPSMMGSGYDESGPALTEASGSDDLVGVGIGVPESIGPTSAASGAAATAPEGYVNNFIANLADNVKFSALPSSVGGDGELEDNNINLEGGGGGGGFDEALSPPLTGGMGMGMGKRRAPSFHVTYWMFYPYSQGKTMCTLSLGPLGSIPFPAVYGFCLGRRKDIGSHVGDWEHMSLYFNGDIEPEAMYVSAHDAGAYYTYNRLTGSFEFKMQETRKGILQRPNFPKTVTTFNSHPVLFAARGSHGLWTAPGKHRFVKVARLYDVNGFGTPWNTWKSVDISYENVKSYGRALLPTWLSFKGKWGNPKSKCHPFRRIGLNFCEYTDGPTGIPLKERHFQCGATYRL